MWGALLTVLLTAWLQRIECKFTQQSAVVLFKLRIICCYENKVFRWPLHKLIDLTYIFSVKLTKEKNSDLIEYIFLLSVLKVDQNLVYITFYDGLLLLNKCL